MTTNDSLAHYIGGFFNDYLAIQRGVSDNTILAYRDSLKLLFCYIADKQRHAVDKLKLGEFNHRIIISFLNHLEQKRGVSIRTRNARLAAIRTFFAYIARESPALLSKCQLIRSIPTKKTQHREIEYLNEAEIKALLQSVDMDSRTGARDNAILLLMFNSGARAQELVDVKIRDLRLDKAGQIQLVGKGNKRRSCPLWPETVAAIKGYLDVRGVSSEDECLFLNVVGQTITRFGLRYIVKKYSALAAKQQVSISKKSIGPHSIRHSTAVHLIKAGNEINMVRIWLGHANINTTHTYVDIDLEMKRVMLMKTSPPECKTPKKKWRQENILCWLDSLSKPKNYVQGIR
jgi:integrase/recombinase XerD